MVADIMAEQIKAGHEVTLLIINRHYEQPLLDALPHELQVVRLDRPQGSHNPLWFLRYNLLLRRTRPDIIHFHQVKGAYYTIHPRGVPMVHTVHDTAIPTPPAPRLDRVFAISQAVSDDLSNRYGMDSVIVENGIASTRISKRPAGRMPSSPLRLVNVARLTHPKKGQDIAIEAMGILASRGIDATLDLIGEGESEPFLRELADRLGVGEKVRFLGNRSRRQIYSTLADYDIFLLPSRNEGFGLTVAEAMAACLPVVVSDIEGPMEIIGNGRYGTPFESGNPHSLADAITAVATDYPRHAATACGDAYRRVMDRYDISRTAREYLGEYARLTNKP